MEKKWSKVKFVVGLFIFQIILYQLLFSSEQIINFIVNSITFPISGFVGRITNSINLPLGEIFYLIVLIYSIYLIIRLIINLITNKKRVPSSVFHFLLLLNIVYFVYTFAWSVMYKKESITFDKETIKIDPIILKEIYCAELDKAIYFRNKLNVSDRKRIKYSSSLNDYNEEFVNLQYKLKDISWLKNYRFLEYPQYKLSTISIIQNYIGILGYYNPFTVESNLNKYNTKLKQSSTMFHEYGHQMGFASESEANFLAYYLGTQSKNPETNYSVYYKSIFSLLSALAKTDPLFVKMELDNLDSRIKFDRQAEIDYYAKYEGKTSETFSELNNQFLKANNQEGTISYSKYVEFIYYLHTIKKRNY